MTRRILIGPFPEGSGTYGVRVSQPGYDVMSNPVDNSKLVFNSDWQEVLAIANDASGNPLLRPINASAAGVIYPYSHNLGYIPFVAAFVNINNQGWENYHSSNQLLSKSVRTDADPSGTVGGKYWFSNQNDKRAYSFDGNASLSGIPVPHVQIKVTSSQVTCMCTVPAKFFLIIYKARAF